MRFISRSLAIAASFLPFGAMAETESEIIFSRKAWQVEVVGFDDGSTACVAQVTRPRGTFSIWVFEDESVRLQFFSDEWEFEESNADLEVQIDRRGPWTLTNADLYQNSVLFNLPDSRDGVRFMVEVAKGKTLFLRDEDGADVRRFPLAGSSASMQAMVDCGETIAQGDAGGSGSVKRKSNPFN